MNTVLPLGMALLASTAIVNAANVDWPHQQSDIKPDPQTTFGKLPNGLKYVIRPNAEPPGRMSIRLHVDTGSLMENEKQRGLAHFIEHMVFNGSKHFKTGEMIPTMQRLGLGFGGDANAYTSFDRTVYMLDVPNLKDETLDAGFKIIRDFADGATFPDAEIDKERGVIINELKLRDSIEFRQMEETLKHILDGTLTPERFPIGKVDIIKTIPREEFVKFYNDFYTPERMTVVLVGDFKPDQAIKWLQQYFGDMKSTGNGKNPTIGTPSRKGVAAKAILDKEASRTSVSLNNISPFTEKPDTAAQRVKDITLSLANDMLNRRFSLMLKNPDCPFAQASAEKESLLSSAELMSVQAVTSPEKWSDSLHIIENELRRAIQFGFSPAELAESRANVINSLETAAKTWPTSQSKQISDQILESIGEKTVFSAPDEDINVLRQAIQKLTPEDCQKALASSWNPEQVQILVTGNANISDPEQAILAEFKKASGTKISPPAKRETQSFAYETIGQPGKVKSSSEIADLGIRQITLANGVRVNLKKTNFQQDTILVSAAIDGGQLSIPANLPGIELMAKSVMAGGGLAAHSMDDLARILAGKNVGFGFDITEDRFVFSGSTTPNDLELQLKLLAASMLYPGFREDGVTLLKRQAPMIYDKLSKDAAGVFQSKVNSWTLNNDFRFSFPERQQLESRTAAEVRDWLASPLAQNPVEISIVGDFDPATIENLLARTVGAMPQRPATMSSPAPAAVAINRVKAPQTKRFEYPTSLDKAISIIMWPGVDGKDTQKLRRLDLLSEILDNRLQQKIREEMGDTYTPQAAVKASQVWEGSGRIFAISPGDTENTDRVCAAIREVGKDLTTGNITADELDRARRPVIARIKKSERDNGYWLSAVLSNSQAKPAQLDDSRQRLKDLESITVDELNKLAAELFTPEQAVTIQIVPAPESPASPDSTPKKPAASQQAKVSAQSGAPASGPSAQSTQSLLVKKGSSSYAVLVSPAALAQPEWKAVANALVSRHKASLVTWDAASGPSSALPVLRDLQPTMMAVVDLPEGFTRARVSELHRLTRKFDNDPYGDCIFGLISGYTAKDALNLVNSRGPLVISRGMGTTNINHNRFDQSFAVTDWGPNEIIGQEGRKDAVKSTVPADTTGTVQFFARNFEKKPQLLVTSAHATQFNLEMPFGSGLIASMDNKFHILKADQRNDFARFLSGAMFSGNEATLANFLKKTNPPVLDMGADVPKVWLAAGNCLLGDAKGSKNSMVITALSSGGFKQLVGYTVPSWYGKGGWGTLTAFFDNHAGTTLAQAWYLNNQDILAETIRKFPKLVDLNMDCDSIDEIEAKCQPALAAMVQAGYNLRNKDLVGLFHDRDVVAFWGDPAYSATLSEERSQSPWKITPLNSKTRKLSITATQNHSGRFMTWFTTPISPENLVLKVNGVVRKPDENWTLTNNFILINDLKLDKGQSATLEPAPAASTAANSN